MSAKKRSTPQRADKRFANRSLKKGASAADSRPGGRAGETVVAKAKRTLKSALKRLKP